MPASDERRFVIIGAGAVGGTLGGLLSRAGTSAVLIARGRHGEVLAADGLTLRTPDGTFHASVTVASSPEQVRLTPRDVLVFATKTQQLDGALQEWVDRPVSGTEATAGEVLPAMTALNGVSAEEKALRYFARVFGICVWLPTVFLEPGEVIVQSWPVAGQCHIARWPATAADRADAELLTGLAETWTAAGIRVQTPRDVAPWKYNKLLGNLGNAVGALTAGAPDAAAVVAALRAEAQDVLRSAGIEFISHRAAAAARTAGPAIRPVPGWDNRSSNSTWQSFSRDTGNAETDFLNGEIARIAHRHGGTAPLNAAVARAVRTALRTGAGPGHYTAAQLEKLLGIGESAPFFAHDE